VTMVRERSTRLLGTSSLYRSARLCLRTGRCCIIKEMPVSCIRAHLSQETKMPHRQSYSLAHNSLERGSSLKLAGVSDDERLAQNFASISELRINCSLVFTISLCDTTLRTLDFATRRSVKVARCFDSLVTVQSPYFSPAVIPRSRCRAQEAYLGMCHPRPEIRMHYTQQIQIHRHSRRNNGCKLTSNGGVQTDTGSIKRDTSPLGKAVWFAETRLEVTGDTG
jgi:hypothetical protein